MARIATTSSQSARSDALVGVYCILGDKLTNLIMAARGDGNGNNQNQIKWEKLNYFLPFSAGEFVTESLQVPQRCHFSHIAGKDKCNDYKFWNVRAEEECGLKVTKLEGKTQTTIGLHLQKEQGTDQPMRLRSFAILEPCGLGMFRGVEFVCCPKELEERIEKVVDLEADKKSAAAADEDEEEEDDDEEYSEEDEEEEKPSTKKEAKEDEQDPYFKDDQTANEHDRFREAEERLEKKHRKKVTKVITEWSELFER